MDEMRVRSGARFNVGWESRRSSSSRCKSRTSPEVAPVHKIWASCSWGCAAMHGTVSACFGTRHEKPCRRVHSNKKTETNQVKAKAI
jgi:hypothetical protein